MKVCFIGKLIFQLKGKLVTFNLLCCFNDDAGLADARTTTRRVERHGVVACTGWMDGALIIIITANKFI